MLTGDGSVLKLSGLRNQLKDTTVTYQMEGYAIKYTQVGNQWYWSSARYEGGKRFGPFSSQRAAQQDAARELGWFLYGRHDEPGAYFNHPSVRARSLSPRETVAIKAQMAKELSSLITKSLDDQVLAAVEQDGSLVSLRDLGTKLGTSPATLFAAVNRLRRAGKLTASGYEGRFGAGKEDQRWLMPEAGSHPIGYVSMRR